MTDHAITRIRPDESSAAIALWQAAGLVRLWNDPGADIAAALNCPTATILAAHDAAGALTGTAMAGYDGHRGWIYYVAVDPDCRKRGLGRVIMAAAEDWLRQAGIAKLQLLVRRENAQANAFYQSLGFEESTSVMFQKWLDGRAPTP